MCNEAVDFAREYLTLRNNVPSNNTSSIFHGNIADSLRGFSSQVNDQGGLQNIREKEKEVHALQKDLNLPQTPSLLSSSEVLQRQSLHQHGIHDIEEQYYGTKIINHAPLSATATLPLESLNHYIGGVDNLNSTYTMGRFYDRTLDYELIGHQRYQHHDLLGQSVEVPSLQHSQLWNPGGVGYSNGSCERILRSSLGESEMRRSMLLDKIKDAHLIIQSQTEKLTFSENEILSLRGQVKTMAVEQKIYQQELETLRLEQQDIERVKAEGISNNKVFHVRINQLDNEFRSLAITHNALLVESKKKEAILDQNSLSLNVLEECNKNLQQANDKMMADCAVAGRHLNEARTDQQRLRLEKQQAKEETAKAVQDYERMIIENNILKTKNSDANKMLKEARTRTGQLEQAVAELKMTKELESNRLDLLEEDVSELQQTRRTLRMEKDQLFRHNLTLEREVQKIGQEKASVEAISEILKTESTSVRASLQREEESKRILEEEVKTLTKQFEHHKNGGERDKEHLVMERNDLKEKLKNAKENIERERRSLTEKFQEEKETFKYQIEQAEENVKRLSEEKQRLEGRCQELDKQLQRSHFASGVGFWNVGNTSSDVQADGRTISELRSQIEQLVVERSTYTASLHELQSRHASVEEENRRLKKEYEENKELLRLTETEKSILEREQSTTAKKLQNENENEELKQRIKDAWKQIDALNDKAEQQTDAMKRLLDVSKDSIKEESAANIMEDSNSSEIDSLKDQLTENQEECNNLRERMDSTQEDYQRLLVDNRRLNDELDDTRQAKAQLEKDVEDLANNNQTSQINKTREKEQQTRNVKNLQEEVKHIKDMLTRLDVEKSELMAVLEGLRREKEAWNEQKGELIMSQAELEAENKEMRQELEDVKEVMENASTTEIENLKKEMEAEKMESTRKSRESARAAAEEATKELRSLKSELDKVWEMLRIKDNQLEMQAKELSERQTQLNRWADKTTLLKKDFADMATKTSSRNQVISTLRDQLMERTKENAELNDALVSANQQIEVLNARSTKLERDFSESNQAASKWVNEERSELQAERDVLKESNVDVHLPLPPPSLDLSLRRRSDGSLPRRVARHHAMQLGVSTELQDELRVLKEQNARLKTRLDDLRTERDAALQDSEDLREGMQQLKEAFEDEIERELEFERERFNQERDEILKEKENSPSADEQPKTDTESKMEEEFKQLLDERASQEMNRKNLEFERDELRRQIEELCENTARSEEKGIQVDLSLPSPRRREQKPRKRSASVGVIMPIITVEEPSWSPQSSPRSTSPRRVSTGHPS